MSRDAIKRESNEAREMPRWTAVAWYRTENGLVDVTHEFMELTDLNDLIERGPDWHALEKIEITYNTDGRNRLTVEEAEKL